MVVSDRDKEYMRRLAQFEGEGAAQRHAAHLSLTISERLRRSLAHWVRFRGIASTKARNDSPGLLYERAKQLGLYLP